MHGQIFFKKMHHLVAPRTFDIVYNYINFTVTSQTRRNLDEVYQQGTGSQEIASSFSLEKGMLS